jgi:hypothetical protein
VAAQSVAHCDVAHNQQRLDAVEKYERGQRSFVALWIQSTGLGNERWALDLARALRDPEGHQTSY